MLTRRGFLGSLAAAALAAAARVYSVPSELVIEEEVFEGIPIRIAGCTCGGPRHTLICFAERLDPDFKVRPVAELLAQSHDLFDDVAWVESSGEHVYEASDFWDKDETVRAMCEAADEIERAQARGATPVFYARR